jgi:hypothetical protein
MVGILKIQLGRLWVFSSFLLFDMSFEALFMLGLVCIETEFKLIQSPMQLGVFVFAQKEWVRRAGLKKKM